MAKPKPAQDYKWWVLSFSALALWILIQLVQSQFETSSNGTQSLNNLKDDTWLWQVERKSFDENGKLVHQIQATQARQENDQAPIQLWQPSITWPKAASATFLHANQGTLNTQNQLLDLENKVSMKWASLDQAKASKNWNLTTEKMRVELKQEKANTQEKVFVQGPDMSLTAQGFTADFQKKTMLFSSQVKTKYDPL
jgi:LPS export ABC transporter protein LptC